ncbi:hypothetical protein XA68_17688 [Ophiocordyceps unilateralis]|uniref:Uncharacterized protein n=1 Tax=Ophiocordyceps unilateralis TaxID=268505 RepID=A0A2A9P432_OPHUN|nr:hypothetical protein XA68_17688 [Ophiocordyceps unilateralis]
MRAKGWILVSPASRGIGHALTRHLLRTQATHEILATTRSADDSSLRASLLADMPSSAEARLRTVTGCDVTDEDSVRRLAALAVRYFPLSSYRLHLACVLPGLLRVEKALRDVDVDAALQSFRVNAIGPLIMAKHFFPLLPRRIHLEDRLPSPDHDSTTTTTTPDPDAVLPLPPHATFLTVAARVGSTSDNRSGGWFSYRASKAAVFSLARSLDLSLQANCGDAALAIAYHPGTVRTDFTRQFWHSVPEHRLFTPQFAAERLMRLVCGLSPQQRGKCWDWQGLEVPP